MDRQIIAIGGGGFGRHPGVGTIEKYILQQSDKEKPNICFIATATGDSDSYKVSYYATLNKLNCNPTHLDFFKRTPNLEELIKNQDIIFAKSHSIFLHCDCKLIWERIKNGKNRPLLNNCDGYDDFEQLYRKRETAYQKADIVIFNDKNYSINEMAKITVNKYYSFLTAIRESNIDEKC